MGYISWQPLVYVKTITAYPFQGLLIIVILNIFDVLVESQITASIAAATGDGSDVNSLGGFMFLLAAFSCLLAFVNEKRKVDTLRAST